MPAAERIDRREKRMVHQQLASLRAYLIVDQDRRVVDWYARADDGAELPPAEVRSVREDEPAYG